MAITAIIPFRNAQEFRIEGVSFILRQLKRLGFATVLVEQSTKKSLLFAPVDAHILYPVGGEFARAKLLNIGAKNIHSKIYAFCEADIAIHDSHWEEAIRLTGKYQVISPYNEYCGLEKDETQKVFDTGVLPSTPPRKPYGLGAPWILTGGSLLMSRRAWQETGGWDEHCVCLGGDDVIQAHKVRSFSIRHILLNHSAYHLWHSPFPYKKDLQQKNSQHQLEMLNSNPQQLRQIVAKHNFAR